MGQFECVLVRRSAAVCSLIMIVVCLSVAADAARGETITGNPSSDGEWTLGMNSMSNGGYIRGTANSSYDIYTKSYTLTAGSALLKSDGAVSWNVGDTILAMGGVLTPGTTGFTAGWGANFSGDAVNSNITYSGVGHPNATSTRVVSKFGTSPTAFSPSTIKPNGGNGNGAGSTGAGGDGTIILSTDDYTFYPTISGQLVVPQFAQQYHIGINNVVNIDGRVGQVTTNWNLGTNKLIGFETFLNLTLLNSQYAWADAPQSGDRIDQALQRGSGVFTDGLGTMAAAPAVVPTPTACAGGLVLFAVCLGMTAMRLRRV